MTPPSILRAAALAAQMSTWPAPASTEAPECRRERLETIALATEMETNPAPPAWMWSSRDLALAVLVKTWWESGRWSRAVHDGSRTGDHGRARCLGQLHQTAWVSRDEWLGATGVDLDSTRLCLRLVVRVLVRHQTRCLPAWVEPSAWAMSSILGAYGTGYTCKADMAWAQRRAWMWWRVRGGS